MMTVLAFALGVLMTAFIVLVAVVYVKWRGIVVELAHLGQLFSQVAKRTEELHQRTPVEQRVSDLENKVSALALRAR